MASPPPNSNFLLLATIPFLAIKISPSQLFPKAPKSPSKLIQSVCNETTIYGFCMNVFASNPQALAPKDALALSDVALTLGRDDAEATLSFINRMLASKDVSFIGLKPTLNVCVKSYESLINAFSLVKNEVKEDAQTANYDVLVMHHQIRYCNDALVKAKGNVKSNISQQNRRMSQFASIAARATDAIPTEGLEN